MPNLDPASPDFYDLVIVGRGYSASTYLFTADLSWCQKILIIAGPDAWEHVVRGDGIVNHANYIYARDNPSARINPAPEAPEGNKTTLKDENAAIIAKAITWLQDQHVAITQDAGIATGIDKKDYIAEADIQRGQPATIKGTTKYPFDVKRDSSLPIYEITYNKWENLPANEDWDVGNITPSTAKALKVVYCGGAGPHIDYYNNGKFNKATFMDLDSFMRSDIVPTQDGNNKVALLGPNAGVDAAVKAISKGFDLYWLISGPQDSNPAWLSTKHYTTKRNPDDPKTGQDAIDDANGCIVNYPKSGRPSFVGTAVPNDANAPKNAPYTISFAQNEVFKRSDEDTTFTNIEVGYVVYATGQNPEKDEKSGPNNIVSRIGPAKVLETILAMEKLTPIYDTNQRFGGWHETALGLKDKDHSPYTGLEVFGAAALALANFKGGSKVKQAFFESAGFYTNALDTSIQPGANIGDSLKAIQNSSWNDSANTTRLYDYFNTQDSIPTVNTSMTAILPRLYLQTLLAADQLGVVKSQIEAATGFGLIAASTDTHEWIVKASAVQQATEQIKQAIKNLPNPATAENLGPLKEAVGNYNTAVQNFGAADEPVNEAAVAYVALLSQEDRDELQAEDFRTDRFAININQSGYTLFCAVEQLSASDDNYLNLQIQQDVIKKMPAAQRQLTNLQAVFQTPTADGIQSAINFNSMDRTQLAVLLAAKYPAILAPDWRPITAQILEGRRFSPWGYTPEQVTEIETWLGNVNKGTKSANEFPDLMA
ncbi:hypothetical protein [Thalassospira lucentensis]|uniref:hypothetical protein n=1 Tax=Thalassospira lucentensis TaxID=168935 RepID=UPI0003B34471|nr:hypothetical protein [Thalassospira lucentensis]RCK21170.1 hypothetical protein TH1_18800 [Thalassospira lucentensis MCCC 1A00383 = DSM 14000]